MKKICTIAAALFLCTIALSSCYVNRFDIGKGAQSTVEVHKQNHYFIVGLIPGHISNPPKMAAGSPDYTVTILHTFLDGVLGIITFGIYTPTTTIVQK